MDRYIYIQSDESDRFFEDNSSSRFTVQLKFPLYLPGLWKVALVEFHATEKSSSSIKADEGLYIYTDLCKESIVNGEERPLLRRLEKNGKGKWDYLLDPFYVTVKKRDFREFNIYIKKEDGTEAIDLLKPVRLTLHLKRCPFF